jgi:hypothetical protein
MKNKGSINLEIVFPIISIFKTEFSVVQTKNQFTICNNQFLEQLKKNYGDYRVLDSLGNLYSNNKIERLGYTNILFGFNLAGGTSTYFANVYLEKISELSIEELKKIGFNILKSKKDFFSGTMLNIKKWQAEFKELDNREDVLRYIFYFVDTSRYRNPDSKDLKWRENRGFVN